MIPAARKLFRRIRNGLLRLAGPMAVGLWLGSIRLRLCGPGLVSRRPGGRKPVIFTFWHERLLMALRTHKRTAARTLVSHHADGEMVAAAARSMGLVPLRGSTARQGFRAMRQLLKDVANGYDYGLTPDGPRGPRRNFHVGTVYFASRSGLSIIPCTVSYGRFRATKSWDRFLLPMPFTRALVYFGEPVRVPPDLDAAQLEAWAEKLGRTLTAVTEENDRLWRERFTSAMTFRRFRKTQIA